MNLKILMGAGLLAASGVFAQDMDGMESMPMTENEAPAVEAPAPVAYDAPAPVAAPAPAVASSSSASVADFDRLRGNAYNSVGNEAAAFVVNDYFTKPYLFGGSEFLYVEPTDEMGVVSWGKENTYVLALDNSGDVGLMTLGFAKKNAFGVTLDLGLGKLWKSDEQTTGTYDTTTVRPGDDFGIHFAMPISGYAVMAHVDWLTTGTETSTSNDATDVEADYWDLTVEGSFSNGPSAKNLFWTAGLSFIRHEYSKETSGSGLATTTTVDTSARFEMTQYFNVGLKILNNERARVFIGSNNALEENIYDGADHPAANDISSRTSFGLYLAPNILAELAFTENWLMFGGVNHTLGLFSYDGESIDQGEGVADEDVSTMASETGNTTATLGLRYQQDRFAAEATLSDNLFSKGTSEIFNASDDVLFTFGGFIYF